MYFIFKAQDGKSVERYMNNSSKPPGPHWMVGHHNNQSYDWSIQGTWLLGIPSSLGLLACSQKSTTRDWGELGGAEVDHESEVL